MCLYRLQTLNLPLEPTGSRTASEGSGSHSKPFYFIRALRHGWLLIFLSILSENGSPPSSQHRAPSKSPSPPQHHNIHIISFDKRAPQSSTTNLNAADQATEQPPAIAPGDNYSYVQLTNVNEFKFAPPSAVDDPLSGQLTTAGVALRRDSVGSLKKRGSAETAAAAGCGEGGGDGLASIGRPMNLKDPTKMKLRLRCR